MYSTGPAQDSASAILQIILTQREGESQENHKPLRSVINVVEAPSTHKLTIAADELKLTEGSTLNRSLLTYQEVELRRCIFRALTPFVCRSTHPMEADIPADHNAHGQIMLSSPARTKKKRGKCVDGGPGLFLVLLIRPSLFTTWRWDGVPRCPSRDYLLYTPSFRGTGRFKSLASPSAHTADLLEHFY